MQAVDRDKNWDKIRMRPSQREIYDWSADTAPTQANGFLDKQDSIAMLKVSLTNSVESSEKVVYIP
jgi:hypothetical protein